MSNSMMAFGLVCCTLGAISWAAFFIIRERDEAKENEILSTDELAALTDDLKLKLKDHVPVRRRDLWIAQDECEQERLKAAHRAALLNDDEGK